MKSVLSWWRIVELYGLVILLTSACFTILKYFESWSLTLLCFIVLHFACPECWLWEQVEMYQVFSYVLKILWIFHDFSERCLVWNFLPIAIVNTGICWNCWNELQCTEKVILPSLLDPEDQERLRYKHVLKVDTGLN